MPNLVDFRRALDRVQFGNGLTKDQLFQQLGQLGVSYDPAIAQALDDSRRYRSPDDVLCGLPQSFWSLKEGPEE